MQDILHTAIIIIPVAFASFMIFDLTVNLKVLWLASAPSTPVPAPLPLPEKAAPTEEIQELEVVPDPWELETFIAKEETLVTPKLAIACNNLLLLPATNPEIFVETQRPQHKPKRVKQSDVSAPRRRGRPRKTA